MINTYRALKTAEVNAYRALIVCRDRQTTAPACAAALSVPYFAREWSATAGALSLLFPCHRKGVPLFCVGSKSAAAVNSLLPLPPFL
eukprot:365815-Chlamydomonas_euryale.AAC.2